MSVSPHTSVIPTKSVDITLGGGDIDLGQGCYGIYVGGTGDVDVVMRDNEGTSTVFTAVPVGVVIPGRIVTVIDATTDASALIALYSLKKFTA
jgi:hypothetical protein